ncbi:3'-phosphoesterase [Candidatus Bathyarchaeota archaeon]|nr:3'-phosphoesterase [Candidatus Bathyarchaeota archaeon]MBS7613758.1 3'-phosphoesterase [Candidatus Bathyarchaeota archaeon]MBS7617289.1 3'-phosphoesterase [Candidatus Bathyarchaeota archaeon]
MTAKLNFVVHEHKAKKAGLHYDLRLESNGVLKDWAFRKAPPEIVGIKRFGIAQEDHDLSWLDFEGEIKEGYGAGTMKIWDRGFYEVVKKTDKVIVLRFYGDRLKGEYTLMPFRNGWLFFKTKTP